MGRSSFQLALALLCVGGCSIASSREQQKEQLGSALFFDRNLSSPIGQSCADCHAQTSAFTDPESDDTTSIGARPDRAGSRNAPTAMYARFAPPLHFDEKARRFVGGLFWDGRANTLQEQAAAPLLNPIEMNNRDKASVVATVRHSSYAERFREVCGATVFEDVDRAFACVTESIAAFEQTSLLSPFSSKYDLYLAGKASLTDSERRGLRIFEDPKKGNCAGCHPSRPSADGTPPLFTNYSYANLGVPKFKNSLFYRMGPPFNDAGARYIDHGLMNTVKNAARDGEFRVPTLRNIARTAPYAHNGYFSNLRLMLDFLNTRDVGSRDPSVGKWQSPEVPATEDKEHVGHLGLSQKDIDDLATFLGTLTDGYGVERRRVASAK
jgi:cytochrome c peroxidase